MAQKNPCIKLIRHPKNCGNGPARNTGMDAARSKYIYFVDADDVLMPNSMATNLDFMDHHNLEALHVDFSVAKPIDVNQLILQIDQPDPICSDVCNGLKYFKNTNFLTAEPHMMELWQVIFRLDVIKRNNLRSINGSGQDAILHIEIMTNVKRMAWSNVHTYIYVSYPNSTFHQRYSYEKRRDMTISLLEAVYRIRNKHHNLYAANGLLQYLDIYRSGICFLLILWPMMRQCISPRICRKDIKKLRKLDAYPIGEPAKTPLFDYSSNRILHRLWLVSRHYHLWMVCITINYIFRKTPTIESDKVGR